MAADHPTDANLGSQFAVHPAAAACARTAAAMGTTARVTVVGEASPLLADAALRRIHELESRWSRFLATSELSRLNASGGSPCLVSTDTYRLVERLVRAWHDTAGRFDPTVHDTMRALGYVDALPTVVDRPDATLLLASMCAPTGCSDIRLDPTSFIAWRSHRATSRTTDGRSDRIRSVTCGRGRRRSRPTSSSWPASRSRCRG